MYVPVYQNKGINTLGGFQNLCQIGSKRSCRNGV